MARSFQVTFDAADPGALARFWAEVLGYVVEPPPDGYATWDAFAESVGIPEEDRGRYSAAVDPGGTGPRLFFQRVSEPKAAKNRVHLDVNASGDAGVPVEEPRHRVDREARRLAGHGAAVLEEHEEHGGYWVVMQDPEGNEFCLQ